MKILKITFTTRLLKSRGIKTEGVSRVVFFYWLLKAVIKSEPFRIHYIFLRNQIDKMYKNYLQ